MSHTLHLPPPTTYREELDKGTKHQREEARQAFAVESTDCGALVGHLQPTWSFTHVLTKTGGLRASRPLGPNQKRNTELSDTISLSLRGR